MPKPSFPKTSFFTFLILLAVGDTFSCSMYKVTAHGKTMMGNTQCVVHPAGPGIKPLLHPSSALWTGFTGCIPGGFMPEIFLQVPIIESRPGLNS